MQIHLSGRLLTGGVTEWLTEAGVIGLLHGGDGAAGSGQSGEHQHAERRSAAAGGIGSNGRMMGPKGGSVSVDTCSKPAAQSRSETAGPNQWGGGGGHKQKLSFLLDSPAVCELSLPQGNRGSK